MEKTDEKNDWIKKYLDNVDSFLKIEYEFCKYEKPIKDSLFYKSISAREWETGRHLALSEEYVRMVVMLTLYFIFELEAGDEKIVVILNKGDDFDAEDIPYIAFLYARKTALEIYLEVLEDYLNTRGSCQVFDNEKLRQIFGKTLRIGTDLTSFAKKHNFISRGFAILDSFREIFEGEYKNKFIYAYDSSEWKDLLI